MSTSKYIQAAVANVKAIHVKHFPTHTWARRSSGPFHWTMRLNLTPAGPSSTPSLQRSTSQSQISVLRWCVELGRIDIITEASKLASYLVLSREGHLEAVFHLFNYMVERTHNAWIVFDPSYADVDWTAFKEYDWKSFYGDKNEEIPPNAPEPRRKDVDLRLFVDSDHAGWWPAHTKVPYRVPYYLYEYGPNRLVLKEAGNDQNQRFWSRRICRHEVWHGSIARFTFTNFEWWGASWLMDDRSCTVTTCQLYTTHSNRNRRWRKRSQIPFAIMLYKKQWPWVNVWRHTCPRMATLLTSVQRLWQAVRNLIT